MPVDTCDDLLTSKERIIQDFLDGIVYEPEYFNRSPAGVARPEGSLPGRHNLRGVRIEPLGVSAPVGDFYNVNGVRTMRG